ncbi:MAG: hypothetical protein ABJ358_04165, partial [Rhizobiaceae bacterium]
VIVSFIRLPIRNEFYPKMDEEMGLRSGTINTRTQGSAGAGTLEFVCSRFALALTLSGLRPCAPRGRA